MEVSLKIHVEEINEGLTEQLLSYSENRSGNEFILSHELGRTIQITFEPIKAVISYEGTNVKGAFRAEVKGDALLVRL